MKYKGKGIGSFGDVSCFSFHATKVFNTIEGGAACFKDAELGDKLRYIKNFGIKTEDEVNYVGANAKMNEFCAAMGLCNLKHVDDEIAKRGQAVKRYRERLGNVDGIQISPLQNDVQPNYAYFPVVFDKDVFGADREDVLVALDKKDVAARRYFYPLTSSFGCYEGKYDVNETPIAYKLSQNVLTLPLFADLTVEDVDRICDVILSCKR